MTDTTNITNLRDAAAALVQHAMTRGVPGHMTPLLDTLIAALAAPAQAVPAPGILAKFVAAQERLGHDFEKVLQDNIPALYAEGNAAASAHPDDAAVDRFAIEMKSKLAVARAKGRSGWDTPECTQQHLSNLLREHVTKGDPRDVANFCMFLWARGEAIAAAPAQAGEYPALGKGSLWRDADGIHGYGADPGSGPWYTTEDVRRAIDADRAARGAAQAAPVDAEDAKCWHFLATYLVGPRTDLDDEIVASVSVNELRKVVDAARAAQKGGA